LSTVGVDAEHVTRSALGNGGPGVPVPVEAISTERLQLWLLDCIRDHATPALLLAIGHDDASGEAHVYVPDDPSIDTQMIKSFLLLALRELDDADLA
jgi:hypothetical protein